MSISIISDIHIKSSNDDADLILRAFCENSKVQNSDLVIFLGDVFDLLIGPHEEYFTEYPYFFNTLDSLLSEGKEVLYFEGNHDLHLKNLFNIRYSDYLDQSLKLVPNNFIKEVNNKKIYFSHGDDLDLDNYSYQIYKKIINSSLLKFISNKILSYKMIKVLGNKASQTSRKRGAKVYNENKNKQSFRIGAEKKMKEGFDIVVAGHSHIKDLYETNGSIYINNGFALKEKTFVYINNKAEVFFEKLFD